MNYVQRIIDGLYVSVDGGFTSDRAGKAFVFHEGAAKSIAKYVGNPEYQIVPLNESEIAAFEAAANA